MPDTLLIIFFNWCCPITFPSWHFGEYRGADPHLCTSSGEPQIKAWTQISPATLEGWTLEVIATLIPDWEFKLIRVTKSYSLVVPFFSLLSSGLDFLQLNLPDQKVQSFGHVKFIVSWDEAHCIGMSNHMRGGILNLGASCQVLTWCLDCLKYPVPMSLPCATLNQTGCVEKLELVYLCSVE